MYVTIIDTETEERRVLADLVASVFWWTEGDGSCDCNRAIAMGHKELVGNREACLGHRRFVAVDVHGDLEGRDKADVLHEMNEGYPAELVRKYVSA